MSEEQNAAPEQAIEQPAKQFDIQIEGEASLTGYQAFTKKEDLLVYEKMTFTLKEEGYPTILSHFDAKLAANPDAWSVKYPQDSRCTINFDGTDYAGELSEIGCSRKLCEDGGTNTYKFVLTRQMSLETVNSLVVPYLNAREEETVEKPKTQWSKGGPETKMVKQTYQFKLTV